MRFTAQRVAGRVFDEEFVKKYFRNQRMVLLAVVSAVRQH